jgi:hypothetical protein
MPWGCSAACQTRKRDDGDSGHTWSTVARVQSGLRTFRPAFRRPSKACCGRVSVDGHQSIFDVFLLVMSLRAQDACLRSC